MRSDSTWMTLRAGLRDLLLQEHHRPYAMFNSFQHPEQQSPQMITLIGGRTKTQVMRSLRLGISTQEGIGGEIHLRADMDGFGDYSPTIFADCEMHIPSTIIKVGSERSPGDIIRRPLTWHRNVSQGLDPSTLAHMVYAKLIAPFSTVICFFAEDFGGLPVVADLLALWLMSFSNRPSDLPLSTHPRVLILVRGDTTMFDEQKATKNFMLTLGREAEKKHGILTGRSYGRLKKAELDALLAAQFGGMRVVAFPDSDSDRMSWKSLKTRILQDSNDLQIKRREAQVAFSPRHFKAFFHLASDHFCSDIVSPFSFIGASRIQDPVPTELLSNVATFLTEVSPAQTLNFAAAVIASAFAFDSYPTGMHGFHPSLVFKKFFYQTCIQIDPFRDGSQQEGFTSSQFPNAVEVSFCQYAFEILNTEADEVSVHRKVLTRFKDVWKTIYSNKKCLACLARAPEDTLKCGHTICVPCTEAHGKASEAEPWTFWLDSCPLCGELNGTKFEHKPDTAGVRALIAEGGGIRGIVSLAFLKELEMAIGLPMGVQEHFDISVGNSTGAITILGLYSKGWSVDECLGQYESLSRMAFRKRQLFGLPLTSLGMPGRFIDILLSLATDSRYCSAGITRALKLAFGDKSSLFGSSTIGGTKVAVVATTVDDSSTCIFTNYNGPTERPQACGYKLIRPDNTSRELLVWHAARASSAAPPYFKPFQGYHDGGLGGHNNPINLALWEQDSLWSRQKKQPDVIVSLGTGFKRNTDSENGATEKLSPWRSRFVPRLFRSFMNFFVGETRWQELQNSLEPQVRDRYHRMNIEFYGDEPELDDLQAMPVLRQQAKSQALSSDDITKCADNLLAALFYLELKGPDPPTFDGQLFICRGRIRCRIGPSQRALRVLTSRLEKSQANFYLDFEQKLPCGDDQTYRAVEHGAAFSRDVTFKVMSLEESIDIKVDGITSRARSISNCPYKIETLIKDQGLDRAFGTRKGRKRSRPLQTQLSRVSKRVKFRN